MSAQASDRGFLMVSVLRGCCSKFCPVTTCCRGDPDGRRANEIQGANGLQDVGIFGVEGGGQVCTREIVWGRPAML